MGMFDRFSAAFRNAVIGNEKAPVRVEPRQEQTKMPEWAEKQKEREEQLWAPGEWEKVSRDLEAVLGKEIASVEVVNAGEKEIKGFKRLFTGERHLEKPKARCEDRKINDPKHGLYAVMDGVSTAPGDYKGAGAAELTSRVVQFTLGQQLDAEIGNIVASGHATEELINSHVAAAMQVAVRRSQDSVERAAKYNPLSYKDSNTTLAMAKLVELPDGRLRMYYANLGDSRIQLVNEDGSLTPLTEDDKKLKQLVANGEVRMTPEELDLIDQYVHRDQLTPDQARLAEDRSQLTRSIGMFDRDKTNLRFDAKDPRNSDILFVDLEPGQRVAITSDGVHDNSLRSEMEKALKNPDVRGAERQLQEEALAIQKDVSRAVESGGRGKPDDIAAVVFEGYRTQRQRREGLAVARQADQDSAAVRIEEIRRKIAA